MNYLNQLAQLEGKTAVVIGGAGGLGAMSVRALVGCGVQVTVLDRDAEAAQALQAELGETVGIVVGDARRPDALEETRKAAGESVDILVNIVGGTFWSELDQLSDNAIDSLVRLNFHAPIAAIRCFLPLLRQGSAASTAGASIINVTSIEAHRGAPAISVYAAMKSALTSMSASLAVELAPDGIRVNTMAPDILETPALLKILGHEHASPEAVSARYGATIPLGRGGDLEDWAGGLLFLASGLSRYVTGQALHIDGGTSAAAGFTRWNGDGWFPFLPLDVAAHMPEIDEIRRAPSGEHTSPAPGEAAGNPTR
ncbi:putative short-chain dehydrogenase/reductase [Gordonia polyisoprenivorans VH2]|uniref:Putative short-chain dehydrogenase/reductase n=1 Tax=Gordonia polyisoprenivorans (strain DSM 44266 / VH2) TaxID=1112204 RepID=H6N4J2_GORPV|nr:SDR family oxidoreductase [Gordonia polyisoprenivorans]AFA73574.1 putative short-chain dehydrogenase/reductase [Gordonia polyisoprenivorans VH2]